MTSEPDDPSTLGRYRIESLLGAGPFGRVLLGVDETGRRAALRIVAAEPAAEPGFRDRFRREVQSAAVAPPWFCAPILDADPDADPPWLASAFVEGPTVLSFVSANGPLGEQGTQALAVRMADGLVALHGTGLVHRDLTPSNVVLAEDGPRLIDLGVARAADPTSLAGTGHVMGRPEFMAPELLAGRTEAGPAVDIYSFGALVGFAATGRPPFGLEPARPAPGARNPGEDTATMAPIRTGGEPDLGSIPAGLRAILVSCLAEDPAARPTAVQLRDRLAVLDGSPMPFVAPTVGPAVGPTVDVSTARLPTVALAPATSAYPTPQPHYPAQPQPPHPQQQPTTGGIGRWWLVAVAAVAVAAIVVTVVILVNRSGGGTGPTVDPSAAAGPPPAPDGITTVVDARKDSRYGTDRVRFVTPSGNISCSMSADEVRCDVGQNNWKLPTKPADCKADFGNGTVLDGTARGALSCASDSVADSSLKVLDYGTAVWSAGVLCSSRETGVRCENPQTKHGFQVARAAYDVF
jgi:eukaryotic-like serine/threonine-protein kinase